MVVVRAVLTVARMVLKQAVDSAVRSVLWGEASELWWAENYTIL
jgi:hypothetical protein